MLYNDGYTIRGVQKVIKENGTKKLLNLETENNLFTQTRKDNTDLTNKKSISNYSINETKRKKLMNVLDDLMQLRNKLENK